ncbi:hypothetical protein B4589_010905 [Halolamina sp. CBA1230]|uniref:DUF7266 family protein n=1 Tax=Halolamina sp. CBA1230 TaxID=1853690 RepID=UPI0009A216EF|nr:hypothetical protein [Halolamina sp. CBA1230]QKY20860.1 hypothetical protein B4589_010905 [Halolamina sp. CBA1230]
MRFDGDDRGVTPAVGKALEVGIVVLFVGAMTTALYGGAVPDYRDAVGAEVGDRAVVAAAERVENAVPPTAGSVRTVHEVDLPRTIRGENYRLAVEDGVLVLDHPSPAVDARARLALPQRVESVDGAWRSSDDAVVLVTGDRGGLHVELTASDALGGER